MTFAENVKMLRKQAGMSQEQLAEKLGVSRQAVTKWETGAGWFGCHCVMRGVGGWCRRRLLRPAACVR